VTTQLQHFPAQVFDVRIDEIERIGHVHIVAPQVFGNGFFGKQPVLV
jgi:hypothetical protein